MKETVILQKNYIDLLGLTSCIYPAAVFTTVLFLISSCGLTCGVDHHENVYGICKQSKFTIREVSNCPRNHSEWTERAQQLQCHKIQQTCTSRQRFVYHCLPNSYWNKTIELCAPQKYITLKYCPEYNEEGMRVQENYAHRCSSGVVPCPITYTSDKSYKYQQCYTGIKPNIQNRLKDQTTHTNNNGYLSSASGIKVRSLAISCDLTIIVIFTILAYITN